MKIGKSVALVLAGLLAHSVVPTANARDLAHQSHFVASPANPKEGLIVPRASPVRFRAFGETGRARFEGRFVLTGSYSYGCAIDCEGAQADKFFRFDVVPDQKIAARLPRWKLHAGNIMIAVERAAPLVRAITTRRQQAALESGSLANVRGRISIVVDQFEAGLDCDSANYSARFVSLVRKPNSGSAKSHDGLGGCG